MITFTRFQVLLIVFALLVLGASATNAAAVTADLSWTAPETREDGTPMAAGEIASYRVYQAVDGPVPDDPAAAHIAIEQGTAQTVEIDLAPRPEPYVVRFGVRAVDTAGSVSALSNVVTKQFVVKSTAPPGAPTNVTFQITCRNGCEIVVVE